MVDLLENTEPIQPKLFDDDPRVIKLPPLDGNKPTPVLIENKGVMLTLDDGSVYTPPALFAVNQTNRSVYINVYKRDQATFISYIRKDEI